MRSRQLRMTASAGHPPLSVTHAGRGIVIEMGPGAHHRLAFGDAVEAAAHDGFGGQLAIIDRAGEPGRGKAAGLGDGHRALMFWKSHLATAESPPAKAFAGCHCMSCIRRGSGVYFS